MFKHWTSFVIIMYKLIIYPKVYYNKFCCNKNVWYIFTFHPEN